MRLQFLLSVMIKHACSGAAPCTFPRAPAGLRASAAPPPRRRRVTEVKPVPSLMRDSIYFCNATAAFMDMFLREVIARETG